MCPSLGRYGVVVPQDIPTQLSPEERARERIAESILRANQAVIHGIVEC